MGLMEKWRNRSTTKVGVQGPAPKKRKILRVLGWSLRICLILLVAYVVFNQFDASPEPRRYTRTDLPQAEDRLDNGYWLLWTLNEPIGVDIRSEEVIKRSQAHYQEKKAERGLSQVASPREGVMPSVQAALDKLPVVPGYTDDVMVSDLIHQHPQAFDNLDPLLQVLVDRIERLTEAPYFQEWMGMDRPTPVPMYLPLLQGVRLRTAMMVQQGLKGDWVKAAERLNTQLDLGKRLVRGSRTLLLNMMGNFVIRESLLAMSDLLNQRNCPEDCGKGLFEGLPELRYDEYGARSAIVNEYLEMESFYLGPAHYVFRKESKAYRFLLSLLFQKNRTNNHAYRRMLNFVAHNETPPYRWAEERVESIESVIKPFWWLQNPVGKLMLTAAFDMSHTILNFASNTNRTKAFYDILRLSAWLHLRYDGTRTVPELMASPDCPALIDPCSGGPYRWNEEKQVLYSIGVDLEDNGGETLGYQQIDGSDYALPVVLYVK